MCVIEPGPRTVALRAAGAAHRAAARSNKKPRKEQGLVRFECVVFLFDLKTLPRDSQAKEQWISPLARIDGLARPE